jgi:YD repeat-containing protein
MKRIQLIVLLLVSVCVKAQLDYKEMVPPNPDVAAIMKPVTTPVTKYAGIPNISIPLYSIEEDGVMVPISIDYHAGGIKVGEEAGNVGLGWSLQSGGMITRVVNGMDDFRTDTRAYLEHTEPLPDYTISGAAAYDGTTRFVSTSDCNFYVNGNPREYSFPEPGRPQIDHMPDEFMYNVAGKSGTFYFRRDGSIFKKEKDGVIIIPEFKGAALNKKNVTFRIIGEDGTTYHFDYIGTTQTTFENDTNYDSTWYLSLIETKNQRNIVFNYRNWGKIYPIRTFIQDYLDAEIDARDYCLQSPAIQCAGNGYRNYAGPQVEIDGVYLTDISFPNGSVNFEYSIDDERLDIPTGYFVKRISVSNNTREIRYFDLEYSYFGRPGVGGTLETGDFSSILPVSVNSNSLNMRLRLDKITQDGHLEHSFQYHAPNSVPNKTSMAQDYWGFHNGASNSYYFIPRTADLTQIPNENTANRLSSESNAKLFSLKRIIYPTKGYTDFEYELNTFTAEGTVQLPVPSTVSLSAVARADDLTESFESEPFDPDPTGNMTLNFQFAIRGSTIDPIIDDNGNRTYPLGPFDFQQDARLVLVNADTGQEIFWRTYNSEEAAIQFQQTGMAFFNWAIDTSRHPDVNNYVLRAYFNDHGGIYYGQALATLSWQEEKVTGTATDPKDFSIGGGIRIKSISDYSKDGIQATKRNYNYHFKEVVDGVEVEKSYGRIKTLPNYDIDKGAIYRWVDIAALSTSLNVWVPEKQAKVVASASSKNSFSKDMGSYVGYDQVEMTYEDFSGEDNGKTIYKFYNFQDLFDVYSAGSIENIDDFYKYPPVRLPHNGLMIAQEEYKRDDSGDYILIRKISNEHQINNSLASDYNELYNLFLNTDYLISAIKEHNQPFEQSGGGYLLECSRLKFQFHPYFSNRVQQVGQTETVYDENGQNPVTSTQQIFYDNNLHYMPTRTQTFDSEGNTINTQTWYADDINQDASIEGGPFLNYSAIEVFKYNGANPRVGQAIQSLTENNGKKYLSRTNFLDWGGGIYQPGSQEYLKDILAGNNTLQTQMIAYDFDEFGNPLEFSKDNGPVTSYIWGYNKKYVIAKIENATYKEIANALAISETELRAFDEINLATINGLRNSLSKAMVTTYTYEPLVGLTTITDPRGYTTKYRYDSLNRVIEIKDDRDHILSDYKYHYKGQTN